MRKVAGGPAPIGDGRDPAVGVVGVGVGFAFGVGSRYYFKNSTKS